MKKLMVFGVSVIALLCIFLFFSLVSAIRINEIELNPEGTDSGNEWVELYSEQNIDLNGWKLVNKDNKVINLSQSFSGYWIISFSGQWLDNTNEKIILKNSNEEAVDETELLSDSSNNKRTWQYCYGELVFADSTKNSANSCSSNQQQQNQTQNQNTSQNTIQNTSQNEEEIYLEAKWDEDDIVNGEEFEVEVKAFNLKSENYDIKIYITSEENETIISDTYDEEDDKWKSSAYYVNGILTGPGDKSETFNLRIKSSHENFYGDAEIKAKIRKSGTSSIIEELNEDIEILEKETTEDKQEDKTTEITSTSHSSTSSIEQTDEVIRLGSKNKLQQNNTKEENKILYESASEKMKKYAIYAINVVLILIIILLIMTRKKV